jgi:outer membrane receptor protein involved in Fe transport
MEARRREFGAVPTLMLLLAWLPTSSAGQTTSAPPDPGTDAATPVYEVEVRERRPATAASAFVKDSKSFELRILEDPADLLEVTPGLVTGQHAGGGKANQYLVRGFDADHGTDLELSVDGVPVNMRSHAHGQGFADLHWVIPETIERLEVEKGPYRAFQGDFATAGSVNLVPFARLPESFARVELGEFHTQRYLALLSPRSGPFAGEDPAATGLLALEMYGSDGPFRYDEDLWRYNLFASAGVRLGERARLSGWASAYSSRWDASGQIPERAVHSGRIGRFGSIDPSEGGDSDRENLKLRFEWDPSERDRVEADAWVSHYALDLRSNFTLFLEDPVLGDGIVQRDDRILYGGRLAWRRAFDAGVPVVGTLGVDTRTDDAHVRLGKRVGSEFLEPVSDDDVLETSVAGFAEAEVSLAPWARAVVGLRAERFRFAVGDRVGLRVAAAEDEARDAERALAEAAAEEAEPADPGEPAEEAEPEPEPFEPRADGHVSEEVILPKASLIVSPFADGAPLESDTGALRNLDLFFNYGVGYHSNDARDVVANPRDVTLPRALGFEVGLRTRIGERLDVAVAHWWLNLQRELVFVGDEGATEVRPRSRRRGLEVSARLEILSWLYWDAEVAWSHAEFTNGDAVPQAPRITATTGIVARHPCGLSAELRFRALGQRYGIEDRSVRLSGYGIWNLGLRYRRGPFEVSLLLENLTNRNWRSAEFFYTSRLRDEPPEGVDDFHFTPGSPRNFRVGVAWYF